MHPKRVRIGRNIRCAFDQQINIVCIPRHLRADDIVSAGEIGIIVVGIPLEITVSGIADIGGVVRGHIFPLLGSLGNINGLVYRCHRNGTDSLVLTDEIDHLIVVMVLEITA